MAWPDDALLGGTEGVASLAPPADTAASSMRLQFSGGQRLGACVAWDRCSGLLAVELQPRSDRAADGSIRVALLDPQAPEVRPKALHLPPDCKRCPPPHPPPSPGHVCQPAPEHCPAVQCLRRATAAQPRGSGSDSALLGKHLQQLRDTAPLRARPPRTPCGRLPRPAATACHSRGFTPCCAMTPLAAQACRLPASLPASVSPLQRRVPSQHCRLPSPHADGPRDAAPPTSPPCLPSAVPLCGRHGRRRLWRASRRTGVVAPGLPPAAAGRHQHGPRLCVVHGAARGCHRRSSRRSGGGRLRPRRQSRAVRQPLVRPPGV